MIYPHIDPVAFHLPFVHWPVYWYGIMYLVGFGLAWLMLSIRLKTAIQPAYSQDQLSDTIFYAALGAIIGGRIGYMVFYDTAHLIHHPLSIIETWKGGMSFHGGLLGVLVALYCLSRRFHKPFLHLTDFIAPGVPLGLCAGRIGNFINGELWGRPTDIAWGMIFPQADMTLRHPSQLYEAGLEGIALFIILWWYSSKPRPLGAVSGLFALFYGIFRIIAECFREPDAHIGFLANTLTEGQLLSLPLVFIGAMLLYIAYTCNNKGGS